MKQVDRFDPIRILEVELSQPLPAITGAMAHNGHPYRRATILVRLHTQPLGWLDLPLPEQPMPAAAYAERIWQDFHWEINQQLQSAGLPPVRELTAAGLPPAGQESPSAPAPLVSVVVPTRHRPEQIIRCVRSLLALDYPNYEIIVVDNAPGSTATAEAIAHAYPQAAQVRYVREERLGVSWARNHGVLAARAELITFADDDVVADRYWLRELVRGFSAAPNVGCVTGMILPLELETAAQLWLEQYGGYNKGFVRQIYDLAEHRRPDPLYPYTAGRFGSGANMAFKKSVLRAIGNFDPALGSGSPAYGGEDLAAFFQVIMQGYKLVYQPTALIYHPHHREYTRLQQQLYGYGAGLSAFLTKCLRDDPRRLLDFASNLLTGLAYVFSARSPKNQRKQLDYPRELTRTELRGMLYGPLGYLRSRRQLRTQWQQAGDASRAAESIAYREKTT
jgi:GT2 family glycosyltransferase